ncbi:MAG: hypothetical protein IMZ43_08765 [Thermoplasmata archaeon]|nr:hypothetical protein [Thermoplasmata archaeon]
MSKLVNTGFPSPGSQRASFAFIADEQEGRTIALDHCPKSYLVLILNVSYSNVERLENHLLFLVSPYGDYIIRIIPRCLNQKCYRRIGALSRPIGVTSAGKSDANVNYKCWMIRPTPAYA